ncbi:hypothetical protein [Streptomyces sp. NK08204]|uniref:hypothetical protein n=1 Tax=Streptomyces sp. NK08204 TaxID=2873260 RepID=UPI001CECBEB5|nr:hypothetical protein [Streptomyces sp. NK08204]
MKKAALRTVSLAAAASCCLTLGAWGASAGAAGALPQKARAAPASSVLQCYATRGSPNEIVCYRHSWKAEFRHGEMVYVPILIQVPMPSAAPSVTVVDSLNDIRPS